MPRGPQAPGPLRLPQQSSREVYLPDSRFLALGPTGAHPGSEPGPGRRRTGQVEAPSAPAPFSLPLPLLWPAATQGGVAQGELLSQGQSGHPSFTHRVPMPPAWVTHKCLNSRPSWGGLSPPQLLVPLPPCPSLDSASAACVLPTPLPEPRRPAAFTAPHLAPPSASALWPLHSPFHTISPRAPRVLRPSAACPGSPPRLHQPCGLPIPLDPSSLVPTPEHTGK